MRTKGKNIKFVGLLCLSVILVVTLTPSIYPGFATPTPQNNTVVVRA